MSNPKTGERKPPSHIEVFSDARDGAYWLNVNGRFVALKKSELKTHLITMGMTSDWHAAGQGNLIEFDWVLWNSQRERLIDYAGPLAGHKRGIFTDGSGRKYLVTDEANGIWAKLEGEKEPKFFSAFVQELLPDGQWEFLCHWLAIALRSLRRSDFRPGQVVVFAGQAQCGKSLMQAIITEILGGRSASPFRYLMDLTQFNRDLAGAEHWQIEDPPSTTDTRTRRQFGNKIKEATVNRDFSIHAKGKDALNLPIFRRVTISVNDEPENLAVVPPLDRSIEDKIFLFQCAQANNCFKEFRDDPQQPVLKGLKRVLKTSGEIDRKAVWQAILAEIPAIRSWLLREFKTIPTTLRDDRFVIKAWHHPKLRQELLEMDPSTRFLHIIDDAEFSGEGPHTAFSGKASDLERKLRDNNRVSFDVEKLLRFSSACGTYLARIERNYPDRISSRVLDGHTVWTIQPPSNSNQQAKANE